MKSITFKPQMIDAIRAGRKTQTRRIKKGDKPRYKVGESLTLKASRFSRNGFGQIQIGGVRSERLQDITNADAYAEGIMCTVTVGEYRKGLDAHGCDWLKFAFRQLWDSIHGDGAWNLNPEVWVYEFEVVGR